MMLTPPNSPHSEHIPTQPDFKSKLIVVSNRLPITIKRVSAGRYEYNKSSGGLVSGISGLKQDTKFEWYGWPGLSVPADELHQVEKVLKTDYNAVPVSLDDKLADTHYNGFSNSTLWPLLHYQECFSYQQDDWKAYKQVNQLFAERIAADCSDGDTVWVHDYHLLLLPAMLREEAAKLNKTITIGFFLHTPFPASDQFRILPVHRELLHGVLSSDLVGFHTASYAENFNMTCNSVLEPEARFSVFKRLHRPSHVGVYPIGIEPEKFTQELARLECQTRSDLVRARYGDTRIIVGVDRLDYIKGLPRKVQALECFLSRHPEWIGKVTLVQVVVPSRETIPEYKKLWNTLEDLVNGVNQKYGNGTYQPIHLLHCSVPFTELVALYAAADACLISSTRDGMNLVAYEYIASQTQRRGVLLLSEFAGAAEQMRGSLQFNPWDLDDMVGAIAEALTMGEEERATNHERAKAHVMANTSKSWGHSFVSDLERSASMSSMSLTNSMSSISSVASISSMSSVDDIVLKT